MTPSGHARSSYYSGDGSDNTDDEEVGTGNSEVGVGEGSGAGAGPRSGPRHDAERMQVFRLVQNMRRLTGQCLTQLGEDAKNTDAALAALS